MNEKKTPRIRFKGFTDDWEQRKLGDLMDVGSVKRVHQSDWRDSGVRFLRARDVVADFNNEEPDDYLYIDQKMYEEYSAQSGKVQQGDLLVTGVGTIGIPMLIKSEKPLYFKDGNIIWFKNKNAIDGQFFYYSFISKGIQDFIKESAGIGTVGTYTIDSGKKTPINLPTSIEEQKEIGIYFKNLDHLITLHQRKYEKLQIIKKSMLENCFPKNGEKVPSKVGELLSERIEQFPKSDEYPLMAFVANEGVAPKGDRYDRSALVNDTEGKLYKRTEFGDFIYSSNNLETGSIGLNKYGNATISPVYSIFRPTEIADSDFIGRRFVRKDFINEMVKWRQGVIYGQWKIHEEDFLKIEVMVPSLEEQRRIGSFLDNLDHLITLHQSKLEKLQKIKKSLLERMFA